MRLNQGDNERMVCRIPKLGHLESPDNVSFEGSVVVAGHIK